MDKNWNVATMAVQGAYEPKNTDPRVLPLHMSTTYVYDYYVNYDSYCQQLPLWQAENKEYLENARKAAIPAEHTVEIIKK